MRVYERIRENNTFDDIDVRNSYRAGFWIGVVTAGFIEFGLLICVGLYYYT